MLASGFCRTRELEARQVPLGLGVDGSVAGSGDVKTRLESTANMAGVQVTVKAASSGFVLDGKPFAFTVGRVKDEGGVLFVEERSRLLTVKYFPVFGGNYK